MNLDADVAVIGLGAWGSAALWQLAARGVSVLGVEQFQPGHAHGSSHGTTRMFRTACLEHTGLVPLAQRSLTLWHELENAAGRPLFDPTGGLLMGPKDGHIVSGTLDAARTHGIPVEVLDDTALAQRFPAHANLPADHVGVFEPTAGLLAAEDTVRAAVEVAQRFGARVYTGTRVTEIDLVADGVVVRTPARDLHVRQVVVTTGPWATKLVPGLPLDPVRMPMTWFRPTGDADPFALKNFPVFIRELGSSDTTSRGSIWGHGWSDGETHDVKLGLEDGGRDFRSIDPDHADHSVTPGDWSKLTGLLDDAVPGLTNLPTSVTTCMVTRTPDKQFLLGRPRGDRRLVLGVGCGGHGFKHASGIGEALADIVLGRETHCPLTFTDPDRFR